MLKNYPNSKMSKVRSFQKYYLLLLSLMPMLAFGIDSDTNKKYLIDENSSYYVNLETWEDAPKGGDTIFVSSKRTKPLRFQFITGDQSTPVVIINTGGQVKISSETVWGAMVLENCKYIKVTGEGNKHYKYGFKLAAQSCGLAFVELSSDCEAAFIKISHEGFFGIMAKKDYGGYPPSPAPVFSNLVIHDCFVEGAVEGMYLGETKSPGMEFKHVRIYNNIVRNTGRESIQIANMVEDVEIYNNTMLDAGRDEEDYQNNILQIGDNSVAKVYNNIMMGAPGCGIISFGMGNNIYTNNYMGLCKGVFIDNRKFTLVDSLIEVSGNYFDDNVDRGWIIRNMNEYNTLVIKDNVWDADFTFYHNDSGNEKSFTLDNNTQMPVETISFTNTAINDYSVAIGNPSAYMALGAPGGPEFFGTDTELENNTKVSKQIVLNAEMIVDEVLGGSLWAANFLVDEQTLTPDSGEHPISQSWKPYWNMNNGPYHVYFDLGAEYVLTSIALHDMHDTKNLEISVGEPGNWQYLYTEPCDKYKTWKQNEVSTTTRYVRLSMTENVAAAVNELLVFGYSVAEDLAVVDTVIEEAIAPQILLNTNMLVDEVAGGSYWGASYLVDEQDLTPESELHPISESWKPYWNMNNGPYHVYFDLGQEYDLTSIAFHDMNNTQNLDVSIGEPDNWELLFTESCDKYKTWKEHDVNVSTRYVRLSMNESVFAAVNEIMIFGFAKEELMQEKSGSISQAQELEMWDPEETQEVRELFLVQNPVVDNLEIFVPHELNHNFKLEVYNVEGARVFAKDYVQISSERMSVNIADQCVKNGMYILRYSNQEGELKRFKFIKNNY